MIFILLFVPLVLDAIKRHNEHMGKQGPESVHECFRIEKIRIHETGVQKMNIGKNRIRHWDWLLVVGIVLAPMTGLRIWKAGPAEVLCLLWTLKYFPRRYLKVNDTLKFFSSFLTVMFIGMMVCRVKAPGETRMVGYLTWLYLAYIAIAIYEILHRNSEAYNERLLQLVAECSVLWYLLLYFYSVTVSRYFHSAGSSCG